MQSVSSTSCRRKRQTDLYSFHGPGEGVRPSSSKSDLVENEKYLYGRLRECNNKIKQPNPKHPEEEETSPNRNHK